MQRIPIGMLLGFTIVWCLLTGLAAFFLLYQGWRVLDAAHHFSRGEGMVLTSEVRVQSGGDSATYSPAIRYRYRVDDHDYENDRYDFGGGGSSEDLEWSRSVVASHPPGSRIGIWYDPRDPGSAVIERSWPRSYWFLVLFLQPFLTFGTVLIVALIITVRRRSAERRCLAGTLAPGWPIPGIGTVIRDQRGLVARSARDAISAAATSSAVYGLLTFAASMVLGFMGGGFGGSEVAAGWGRNGASIALLISLFLGLAVIAGIACYRTLVPTSLRIDDRLSRLEIRTKDGLIDVPWSSLIAWRTKRAVVRDGEGTSSVSFSLDVCTDARAPLTLLATDSAALANHVASELASATNARFIPHDMTESGVRLRFTRI